MWKFSKVWNDAVEIREERPVVPRKKIWASELGKSDVDIFLKLKGVPPSNDFDARAIRKFEAGNLFEWIVRAILIRAGIYRESQKWIGNSEFGLEVSGRLDHIAGGEIDVEGSLTQIAKLEFPEVFCRGAEAILRHLKEKYKQSLPVQGIEVKSTSSWGIEKVYETNKALGGHDLQAFHYAYNEGIPFLIVYICRDDLRMAEIPVTPNDKELLDAYKQKIERVTEYYNRDEQPPLEPLIVFDGGRFSKNFNVEYSSYLTLLYNFPSPQDYDEEVTKKTEAWNRVLTRIKSGDKITDNNKEKLDEMKSFGFDIDKITEIIK